MLQNTTIALLDENEILDGERRTNGNHHPSSVLQLLEERFRYFFRRSRYDNPIERSMLGPPGIAITTPHLHVSVIQRLQSSSGRCCKRLKNLNRPNRVYDLCQHRRLIARSRSDLKNPMIFLEREQLRHQRNDVRLRDGLIKTDWQWLIGICQILKLTGNKEMPRHPLHCAEHGRINDSLFLDLVVDHGDAAQLEGPLLRKK